MAFRRDLLSYPRPGRGAINFDHFRKPSSSSSCKPTLYKTYASVALTRWYIIHLQYRCVRTIIHHDVRNNVRNILCHMCYIYDDVNGSIKANGATQKLCNFAKRFRKYAPADVVVVNNNIIF